MKINTAIENLTADQMDCLEHVGGFVNAIGANVKQFIRAMDPSESPEVMEYVRSVIEAFDEAVLVTLQRQDSEETRKHLKEANDAMIQELIKLHNQEHKGTVH